MDAILLPMILFRLGIFYEGFLDDLLYSEHLKDKDKKIKYLKKRLTKALP
jgi:hypothetical protein